MRTTTLATVVEKWATPTYTALTVSVKHTDTEGLQEDLTARREQHNLLHKRRGTPKHCTHTHTHIHQYPLTAAENDNYK